jgi:CRP-like cAMP-binding protein
MAERTVALIVHEPGNCSLLAKGDRWLVSGHEVRAPAGARLCGAGLCSIFPKIQDILKALPPDAPLPDDYLLCDSKNCDAIFRMEFAAAAGSPQGVPATEGLTRRLERGAATATAVLRKSAPFLARLPKEVAAELVQVCQTKRYEHGEILLMQGVVGERLYIVAEGNVEVAKRGDKDETVLVTLSRGDCFGEMSILTGEATSAEVRARGKCAVLSVDRNTLEELLLKRPMLSREFSKLLAERLKATNASLQTELSRGIIGKLSMIAFPDLVQTLNQSRRTGTLVLNRFGEKAHIGFRNGTVATAKAGEISGDEAFFTAMSWTDGDFCFEQTPPAEDDPAKVQTDTMGLLMEGMRRMDEARGSAPAQDFFDQAEAGAAQEPQQASTADAGGRGDAQTQSADASKDAAPPAG